MMKKFFVLLILACLLWSCGTVQKITPKNPATLAGWKMADAGPTKPDAENDNAESKYLEINISEDVLLLSEMGKKSPVYTIKFDLLDTDDPSLAKLLAATLYGGKNPTQYCMDERRHLRAEYYENNRAAQISDEDRWPTFNWTYTEEFSGVVYANLIVINRYREYYKGGAHGMRERQFFVLDTQTMAQLRLDEIIPKSANAKLQQMIETALQIKYKDNAPDQENAPLSALGFFDNTVQTPDNFFIDKEGLGFSWDPIDIAPYVWGIIDIVLPFHAIEDMLTKKGASIFALL
jgi:hypothetical protein